ncbi:MAG: hypothetical protein DCC55_26250 [Chloroflexi bacterium]|jgi:Protein of unknown function (DUF3168).|nr:MAG: hypothetical protein DCC55_26250 [Chloroflexota bacterium]
MATLGDSLYAYLHQHPGLSALVGKSIYPTRMPQAPDLPAIVYHQIARRPVHVKKGYVNPIVDVLMQFDVLAKTYTELEAVAAELKRALYGYKVTSPHIYDVMVEGERDGDEIDLRQFHRSIDCSIWLAEE